MLITTGVTTCKKRPTPISRSRSSVANYLFAGYSDPIGRNNIKRAGTILLFSKKIKKLSLYPTGVYGNSQNFSHRFSHRTRRYVHKWRADFDQPPSSTYFEAVSQSKCCGGGLILSERPVLPVLSVIEGSEHRESNGLFKN